MQMGTMDELIDPGAVTDLARTFHTASRSSTARRLDWSALGNAATAVGARPLRARVDIVRDAIIRDVEEDFSRLADVVDACLRSGRFRGWMIWPVSEAVARLAVRPSALEGQDDTPDDAFEIGLEQMRQLTSRLSAEFALRIFLNADADRTIAVVRTWCSDPDEHVRRLASEGTRSYLPWAKQVPELHIRPTLTVPIVDALYRDDSAYVRRSVGNHVNDLSRRHPGLVVDIGKRWLAAPDDNTLALVKRAFRTLIKAGDEEALAVLGFGGDVEVTGPIIWPRSVQLGGDLEVRAVVRNRGTAPTNVAVDYVVNYRKARGQTAPKVFKMGALRLEPGQSSALTKRRSFAITTTRVLHLGAHSVELQVNGRRYGKAGFDLAGVAEHLERIDGSDSRRSG
jgi:3-methyladenine DNA glycosylase AlkC